MNDFDFTVLPDGNLKLTATAEGREALLATLEADGYQRAYDQVFDSFGDRLEQVRPEWTGDLTSAPMVGEGVLFEEDGRITFEGKVWAFLDYQVKDEIDILARTGEVTFAQVHDFGDGMTFPDPHSEAAAEMRRKSYEQCVRPARSRHQSAGPGL